MTSLTRGSFTLMPERALREILEIAHAHDVLVSTGGFIEHILTQGPRRSTGTSTRLRAWASTSSRSLPGSSASPPTTRCGWWSAFQRTGLKAKPEVGIQFGAGGATDPEELAQEGTRDVGYAIDLAQRCLDAGAYMIMIESEGITEEVSTWRTDVVATIARELGLQKVMFEAANPEVFGSYVKNYGPEVNLFVDHSQIVQLECLRRGIWGTKSLWGRVVTYSGSSENGRPSWPERARAGP
jgi:phosphosulfolactate synthase (CoM biosynthesis protein A)